MSEEKQKKQSFLDLINETKSEDDDQNFIKKDEKKSFEEIRNEVASGLASEVKNLVDKLTYLVRPVKKQERNLDTEIGGLEIDYSKKIGDGKDIWDDQAKNISETANQVDANEFEGTQNRSFTFNKKRRRIQKKKRGKDDHAEEALSYAEAVKQARADNKTNNNSQGRF